MAQAWCLHTARGCCCSVGSAVLTRPRLESWSLPLAFHPVRALLLLPSLAYGRWQGRASRWPRSWRVVGSLSWSRLQWLDPPPPPGCLPRHLHAVFHAMATGGSGLGPPRPEAGLAQPRTFGAAIWRCYSQDGRGRRRQWWSRGRQPAPLRSFGPRLTGEAVLPEAQRSRLRSRR